MPENAPVPKDKSGCFKYLGYVFYLILAAVLYVGLKGLGPYVLVVLGVFGFAFLLSRMKSGSGIGEIINGILAILLKTVIALMAGVVFYGLYIAVSEVVNTATSSKYSKKDDSSVKIVELIPDDSLVTHQHYWADYKLNSFSAKYDMMGVDFNSSRKNRRECAIPILQEEDFGKVYAHLIRHDRPALETVCHLLDSVGREHKLNRNEFAIMVVSFIQDIPYTLVTSRSCDEVLMDPDYAHLRDCKGTFCCYGDVRYGVQSPVEFLTNLMGDCDTRTVLAYAILSHFKYDVVIFGSLIYEHSILGINLPFSGQYKVHNFKRYFLWETTAKSLPPGVIAPDQSDMNFWNLHLNANL